MGGRVGADVSADGAGVRVRGAGAGDREGEDEAARDLPAAAGSGRIRRDVIALAHDARWSAGTWSVRCGRDVRAGGAAAFVSARDARRGAGVGKSRLVAELAASHRCWAGSRPLAAGRCLPYGDGIAFWALGEIVKAECGILESDTPAEAAAAKLDLAVIGGRLGAGVAACAPRRRWSVCRATRSARRSRSRRGVASVRRLAARSGRRCSCSRICTGPTLRCWGFSSIWSTGLRGCRCCSSALRGPSCTSTIRRSARTRATPSGSISRR